MSKSLSKRAFAIAKMPFRLVSKDPYALHKTLRPVAAGLGKLPGKLGAHCEQIAIYMGKQELGREAVKEFDTVVAGLSEKSVCIDLGANKGKFTKVMAETGATTHAFEPDPWTFEQLKTEVEAYDNVVLHNAAAGAQAGEITMYRPPGFDGDPGQHSVAVSMFNHHEGDEGSEFTVVCYDFCKFVEDLDCDVDLVKIDIEGAEVALLQALLKSPAKDRIKNIFIETHYNLFPEQIGPIAKLRREYGALKKMHANFNWP